MVEQVQITLRGVSVSYGQAAEDLWALKNIDWTLESGDRVMLIGLNGSGKSTMLKTVSGLVDFSGTIHYNGIAYKENWGDVCDSVVTYVPQDIDDAIGGNITLSELLQVIDAGALNDILDDEAKSWLDENKKKLIRELSGGQKQYIVSAIALAHQAKILLFDEVFRSLDAPVADRYKRLIKKFLEDADNIAVFVSHDTEFGKALSNRVVALREASIVFDSALTSQRLKEACLAAFGMAVGSG